MRPTRLEAIGVAKSGTSRACVTVMGIRVQDFRSLHAVLDVPGCVANAALHSRSILKHNLKSCSVTTVSAKTQSEVPELTHGRSRICR